jgi:glycosyltransferase involved in cell wall biosynthesis
MADAMRRRGHDVELVFRAARKEPSVDSPEPSAKPWWRNAALRRFGHVPKLLLRNALCYAQELKLLDRIQPDLLLAVHQYCSVSPLLAARQKKIPCVLFIETPMVYEYSLFYRDYYPFPFIGKKLETLCVDQADAVIATSEVLKGYLAGSGAAVERIHVIPNGVDETRFRPRPPDEALWRELALQDRKVVGFVGTFQFFVDLRRFMSVLESVCGKVTDAVFLFVGSGGASAAIREEAERRGLGERVRFAGVVEHRDVPRYLSLMDVAICPYRGDYLFYGSALKPLEYMAAGKAVVAPALGQIRELIHDGFNGLLHAWDDHRAMGEAVIRLLEDSSLRALMGANARSTIEREWTWDIQVRRMEIVFREALSKRS